MDLNTKTTIEKLQAKLAELDGQTRKFKIAINGLYTLEGEPVPYPDIEGERPGLNGTSKTIRPDQFYGRPMATVAREILEERKKWGEGAIAPRDLFETMEKGGFEFEGKDDASKLKSLTITLAKNPAFAKVPNSGHIGLADWYPNSKKEKRTASASAEDLVDEAPGVQVSTLESGSSQEPLEKATEKKSFDAEF